MRCGLPRWFWWGLRFGLSAFKLVAVWHREQMERIVSDAIQVLVPPDSGTRFLRLSVSQP